MPNADRILIREVGHRGTGQIQDDYFELLQVPVLGRNAQGIIVVYDITDIESFQNVKVWLTEIEKYLLILDTRVPTFANCSSATSLIWKIEGRFPTKKACSSVPSLIQPKSRISPSLKPRPRRAPTLKTPSISWEPISAPTNPLSSQPLTPGKGLKSSLSYKENKKIKIVAEFNI